MIAKIMWCLAGCLIGMGLQSVLVYACWYVMPNTQKNRLTRDRWEPGYAYVTMAFAAIIVVILAILKLTY